MALLCLPVEAAGQALYGVLMLATGNGVRCVKIIVLTVDAWNFITHDMSRSKAYRWGEEGIAGICDDKQFLCFAVALWNKKDPILKETFFGLSNGQGNHGEDVKEIYYYLDATPTHSYMKMLYKYPQNEFPLQLAGFRKWKTQQAGSGI